MNLLSSRVAKWNNYSEDNGSPKELVCNLATFNADSADRQMFAGISVILDPNK